MKKKLYIMMIFMSVASLMLIQEYNYLKKTDMNKETPYQYVEQYKYHFMAILPKDKSLKWKVFERGVNRAEEEFNMVVELYEAGNTNEQLALLKGAILSEVDGIIMSPLGYVEYESIIDEAVARGIPIVTVSEDVPNSNRTSFIGITPKTGYLAGYEFVSATKGCANVLIVTKDKNSTSSIDKIEGFSKVIETHPEINLVGVEELNQNILVATEELKQLIYKNNSIDSIIYIDGKLGIPIAKLVEKMENRDILVMGYGGYGETLDYIKNGKMYGMIMEKYDFMGYLAVKYLRDIKRNRWVPSVMDPGIDLITAGNINRYIEGDYYGKL